METIVLIAVIVLAIGIGMLWIHLLNAQQDARIDTYNFSAPAVRCRGRFTKPAQP
ncbi:hypothetical protein [Streptomyces sp. NPDC085540]|uniref:hypothetical protein n=1 Tax=Streptomyces sp. NPDC085540 TaxID=3365730 RepID=UPI0037D3BC72